MKAILLTTLIAGMAFAEEKPAAPPAPAPPPVTPSAPTTPAAVAPVITSVPKTLASRRLHLTTAVLTVPEVKVEFEGEPDPETKEWAEEAASTVREWWPQVARLLSTEEFRSPE